MKLRTLGANMTEITLNDGTSLFFSYETPVAAFVPQSRDLQYKGWIRTTEKFSVTTSKHINKYLNGVKAQDVPQSFLDSLMS